MNDIEFIENEIKQLEKRKEQAFKNEYYSVYKECSQKITTLQQIKSELEAWEVVKKHLEYFPSDFYNGIPEEVITMTSQIDKKDYPVIKKALEVENENSRKN